MSSRWLASNYLGVPVSSSRLYVADWAKLEEKLLKRLDGWQGGSLSLGGRKILINSSLSSISIYRMSMYMLPKTVLAKMDKTRRSFFWQGGCKKKRYHLVKWPLIGRPKQKEGLGIQNMRNLNIHLLCGGSLSMNKVFGKIWWSANTLKILVCFKSNIKFLILPVGLIFERSNICIYRVEVW